MNEFPASWRSIPLRDTGTWLSGGTPSTDDERYWGGNIPWISAASLKDFRISHSDRRLTHLGTLAGTRLVPAGTVLFVVRGMSLKTEFRVGIAERQVAFGQDCKAIAPAPGIHGEFLAFALKARSRQILAMVDEAGHGTGRLPTDLISKLEIGIPEPREQQIITHVLGTVDSEIHVIRLVINKLSLQKRGALTEFFDSDMTHDEGKRVDDGLLRIDAGWSPLCSEEPPHPGDWGVLKVSAVTSGTYLPSESKALLHGMAPRPQLEVKAGDVIMCRANGAKELVGMVAMVPKTPSRLMLSDKTLRLVPDGAVLDPGYLHYFMTSRHARRQVERLLSGSSGQQNISQHFIRSMQIPIPSLTRQHHVVQALSILDSRINREQNLVAKLQLVKQGLMEDLLTGRVRVSDL